MTDQEIVARLKAKDEAGLEALMARYGHLLRYVISPILPDRREAEECLADISMKVWEKIGSFDPQRGGLSPWLTVLARNTALNRARGLPRREEALDENAPHPAGSPEDALLRQERMERLRKAIQELGSTETALFYRKYYYCQSTAQMAAELGLSQRAVEGRLYRLREKLRRKLGGDL